MNAIPQNTVQKMLQSGFCNLRFGQMGEDGILAHQFSGRTHGYYVDIGAHHPYRYSNTAVLHTLQHWRGINVDPTQGLIDLFNSERPNDINICCAISSVDERIELFEYDDPAINTINPNRVTSVGSKWQPRSKRLVPAIRLDTLFREFMPEGQQIDYLNIDVEGHETEVLPSNDWNKYRPEMISIEDHDMNLARVSESKIYSFLTQRGYDLIGHTIVTSFYRRA